MKKRRLNYRNIAVLIIVLIIVIGIIIGVTSLFNKPKKETPKEEVKVVDTLDDYGYTLDENETKYYNSLFEELKGILKDDVDYENYASVVARLFLADFFNLDNKITKNDIGGIQFVYKDYHQDFMKFAKNGIYNHVENNLYGDRKQELPIVKEVLVNSVTTKKHKYLDKLDDNAMVVDANIIYENDLGYQTHTELTLVHNDKLLEIVKMTNK